MDDSYKPVLGWEQTHLVSKQGTVKVLERKIKGKGNSIKVLSEHELSFNLQNGYETVALYCNGFLKRKPLHRVVYEAYFGKIPDGMQINHIDGVKTNNHLDNLEAVTPKQNTQHAWRIGLCTKQLGEDCSTSKLKDDDIRKIRQMSKSGISQNKIAKVYNLHQTNVHYILVGKTWSHVS